MKRDKKSGEPTGRNNASDGHDFLVVGIGASAGGVRALKDFFAAMPSDSGMAFVVILHLSQEHKSSLSEIIQRETTMPVHQVTETVRVEPNTVYVIAPAKHLVMSDGHISPKEPIRERGVRVPIDRFFRTLADAYGTKAVSIILSGTGTDGTLGMKHIKGRDGFAIVQDPLDAEYDGMPRSAIETKIVDIILPVAEMPEKLLSVRDSTERLRLADGHDAELGSEIKNIDLLRDVLTLLRVRTGHDFANYKRPTIIRRIARHLQIHETDDLATYLEILRGNPDELLSLLKNLLINVTNFFRDKEAFAALEKKIIPALFEGKSQDDHVRVWIAGCASGEEAYSVAILLNEFASTLPDPPKIQIFATDVDDDVITEAREGRFTEAVVSDVSANRLRLYFTKEDDAYRIRKSIREMVLFAPHNILRDPPFSRLDLITCRNVLIYLNRETQEKVLSIFHFALRPGARLFLGSSESAESVSNLFAPIDKKHRIYQSRPESTTWHVPPDLPVTGVWKPRSAHAAAITQATMESFGELHHRLIEHYAPPSVLIDEEGEILHLSENAGRFLRFVGGSPSNNLLRVIDPALLADLRAALFTARKEEKNVEARNVRVVIDGEEEYVNVIVRPAETPGTGALVIFETAQTKPDSSESIHSIVAGDKAMEGVVRRMEDELRHAKDQLRNTIEQYETSTEEYKASNEELQAINEELRSATEELETGKEELQSVNEELTTVNQELKSKVDEIARINSDLENLMRSTDIATIFLDRNLQIKLYTPPASEIFNVIPADVGRLLKHITHKLSPDNFSADASRVLKTLQPVEREVLSDDGRYFIARFLPYRSIDDKIGGVVVTFVDITERVIAREEQLRLLAEITSAQKFSDAILDQMPAGVIVANSKEAFVFGNRKMAEILGQAGRRAGDAQAFSEWDLRDSQDRQLTPERMPLARALRNAETVVSEEMRLHHSSGQVSVVSVNAAPIVGQDGVIVGGVLAFEDISRRVKVEADLRSSEERLRLMSESFTDYAIFMISIDGTVVSWNTGAEKIFGYAQPEILGESAAILFTSEDRENGVPAKEMKTARETGRASDERWHMRSDGSSFFASGVMAPLFDRGELIGYAKIARDLTEEKKLDEELQRYRTQLESLVEERTAELEETNVSLRQEMMDRQRVEDERIRLLRRIVTTQEEERRRIARDIHDQLGQQLTALRLKIATLADDGTGGRKLGQQIQGLQEAAARLDSEIGFLAWELRPAALDDLGFAAATRNFVAEWSKHYSTPAELHTGKVEGRRLPEDVETNLYRITQEALNNIAKHAEAKNVNVVIERRKDEIVLIIEDDGIGFEPTEIEPERESGKGLGLVGMRERAAIVGGALEIESAPGKGTTIFARVPTKEVP